MPTTDILDATELAALGAVTVPALTAVGDLLYADSTTSFARIAAPAAGQVLKSNGTGAAPSWSGATSLDLAGGLNLGGQTATTLDYVSGVTGYALGSAIALSTSTARGLYVAVAHPIGFAAGSNVRTSAPDTALSRISAGVIGVGTGAVGSVAGTLQAAGFVVGPGTAIPAGGTTGLGYKVSDTANFGVFFGSGAPTLSAGKGSWYLRSDGSGTTDRAYINTDGGTTWTAVTTAA